MNALWSSPLGPISLLAAGGALLLAFYRYLPSRQRQMLPLVLVLVSMGLWLILRWQPPGSARWWAWQAPLGLETALGVQMDGWAWLGGWLAFLAALTALILPGWPQRQGFAPIRLWTPWLLAAALMVMVASSWSTLLMAWVWLLVVTGLMVGTPPQAASRGWTFLILSGLFMMLAPLANGVGTLDVVLAAEPMRLQAQLLLSLAVVLLMGIYPFHFWLKSSPARPVGHQLVLHTLPALAAFLFLSRFQLPLLSSFSWIALGIAGLLGSALAAWAAEKRQQREFYVAINRGTWVMLAVALSRTPGLERGLLPLATLGLALTLWGIFQAHEAHPRWMLWAIFPFLLGLPLTPGFALNLNLSQLATSILGFPGWILILLAQTLIMAAIWRSFTEKGDQSTDASSPARPASTWMLLFLLILGVWWGLSPNALARSAGMMPQGLVSSAWDQIRHAGLQTGWLTLLLPMVLGWALTRWHTHLFAGQESWLEKTYRIASLDWVLNGFTIGFHYLSLALGFGADILDGAGQFGWVLLVLLVLWMVLRK